jgi:hypothetical protein
VQTAGPRLLHRRSELGYTDRIATALAAEPEAVDADTQDELTRSAGMREHDRRRRTWAGVRGRLTDALDELGRLGADVQEELRAMRRTLDRLERKLG